MKKFLLALLLLCALWVGAAAAEGNAPVVTLIPEAPTNVDTVTLRLDREYDRVIVKIYENGVNNQSSYSYNTSEAWIGRLFTNEYRLEVTCETGGVACDPVTITFTVTPAEPVSDDAHLLYEVADGQAIITGYDGEKKALALPSTLGGYPVVEIGQEAFAYKELVSVKIPEGVKILNSKAFAYIYWLESVELPESLREIRKSAFTNCGNLKSMRIPAGVTVLGSKAFSQCSKLASVNIPYGVSAIGDETFYYCPELREISLPETVRSIGEKAFFLCSALERVSLPDTLVSIGESAFRDCRALKDITLPESLRTIGDWAFGGTRQLTSVKLPESMTRVPDQLFRDSGLRSVQLPAGVISIGREAFRNCRMTGIDLPEGLQEIGRDAFYGCGYFQSVTIPASVERIDGDLYKGFTRDQLVISPDNERYKVENDLFYDAIDHTAIHVFDSSAGKLIISEGIEHLGDSLCADWHIPEIDLPSTLKTIGDGCFYNDYNLLYIDIPEGVTAIGASFRQCSGVGRIFIPESVTQISDYAFEGCNDAEFYFKGTDVNSYAYAYVQRKNSQTHVETGERAFEITVDRSEAAAGENVTWTVTPLRFLQSDEGEFSITIENGEHWEHYGPYTLNSAPVITQRVLMNGEYHAYVYAEFYTWEGDWDEVTAEEGYVTVTGGTRIPLEVAVEADKETAQGEDIVTWTITPSGGVPPYEIHVELESNGGPYGYTPYEDQVLVSNGEPVQYAQQLLFGYERISVNYFPWVTVTDSEGFQSEDIPGPSVEYENPAYEYAYADLNWDAEYCLDGEIQFSLEPYGSVGPYTDVTFNVYLEEEDPVLIDQFIYPVVNQGEAVTGAIVLSSEIYHGDVGFFITEAFKDALGYSWHYEPSAIAHRYLYGVGLIKTRIAPPALDAVAGDQLQWTIQSRREPHYSEYAEDEYELLVTPFVRRADGSERALSEPVYLETYGQEIPFTVRTEEDGEYYLRVKTWDETKPAGVVVEGGAVTVKSPFDLGATLTLPASLKTVEREALLGTAAAAIIVPAGCEEIKEQAFADIPNLRAVYLPGSVDSIDLTAIDKSVVIWCDSGSPVLDWARENGYRTVTK